MLQTRQIHIASTQETNYPRCPNYMMNGYRIITAASKQPPEPHPAGMAGVGVAILIQQEPDQYISQINRTCHRIMTIALNGQPKDTPIAIIAPYAPQSGYGKRGEERCETARRTIEQIPKRNLEILRADASGQLGKPENRKEEYQKITGCHTCQDTRARKWYIALNTLPCNQHDTDEYLETRALCQKWKMRHTISQRSRRRQATNHTGTQIHGRIPTEIPPGE